MAKYGVPILGGIVAVHLLAQYLRRRKTRSNLVIPREAQSVVLTEFLDEGIPGPSNFSIVTTPVNTHVPRGGLLLQALVFSADPYLRMQLKTGVGRRGQPMEGFIAGRVLVSRRQGWQAGDLFGGSFPFSTVQVVTAEQIAKPGSLFKLTGLIDESKISYGVGVLGMPGATAYGGLTDILRPQRGETIWVSGAAGAVGGLVGQIAKNVFGCQVIGSAGGAAKCNLVTSFYGFDNCIDYKSKNGEQLAKAIQKATQGKGIDMYFESVGGSHFEAALKVLRPQGRIAICGSISTYNEREPPSEKLNLFNLIGSSQRVEGFNFVMWLTGQKGNFFEDMSRWLKEGKLRVEETSYDGIERWPEAFRALFVGENTGKVIVRV